MPLASAPPHQDMLAHAFHKSTCLLGGFGLQDMCSHCVLKLRFAVMDWVDCILIFPAVCSCVPPWSQACLPVQQHACRCNLENNTGAAMHCCHRPTARNGCWLLYRSSLPGPAVACRCSESMSTKDRVFSWVASSTTGGATPACEGRGTVDVCGIEEACVSGRVRRALCQG